MRPVTSSVCPRTAPMAAGRLAGSITSTRARLLAGSMRGHAVQRRRAARLQRQHAHPGLVERARELPDGLLDQPPIGHLDHEVGAHLGVEALGGAIGRRRTR